MNISPGEHLMGRRPQLIPAVINIIAVQKQPLLKSVYKLTFHFLFARVDNNVTKLVINLITTTSKDNPTLIVSDNASFCCKDFEAAIMGEKNLQQQDNGPKQLYFGITLTAQSKHWRYKRFAQKMSLQIVNDEISNGFTGFYCGSSPMRGKDYIIKIKEQLRNLRFIFKHIKPSSTQPAINKSRDQFRFVNMRTPPNVDKHTFWTQGIDDFAIDDMTSFICQCACNNKNLTVGGQVNNKWVVLVF